MAETIDLIELETSSDAIHGSPSEGAECMASMDDIDVRLLVSIWGPLGHALCRLIYALLATLTQTSPTNRYPYAQESNYAEYRTEPSGRWHPSLYCSSVLQRLIQTQFSEYVSGVRSLRIRPPSKDIEHRSALFNLHKCGLRSLACPIEDLHRLTWCDARDPEEVMRRGLIQCDQLACGGHTWDKKASHQPNLI